MRRLVLGAVIVIVVGLVVYPVVMVITASFSPRESLGIATVAQKWYSGYAAVRANLRPILNSVVIATGSTLLALVFGTGLAWITARTNVPFRRVIGISILLPFMISPLVLAIGWMILTGPKGSGVLNSVLTGIPGLGWVSINVASPLGIIWVLGLFFTAISYLMMSAAFQNMEPALEEIVSGFRGEYRTHGISHNSPPDAPRVGRYQRAAIYSRAGAVWRASSLRNGQRIPGSCHGYIRSYQSKRARHTARSGNGRGALPCFSCWGMAAVQSYR